MSAQTINGMATLSPAVALSEAMRVGLPTDFQGVANAYRNTLGRDSAVSHFLMLREDIDKIDKKSDVTLKWISGKSTLTVKGLVFDRSVCMNVGEEKAKKAMHLVSFYDRRILLRLSVIDKHYNVRMRTHLDGVVSSGTDDIYKTKYFYKESVNTETDDDDGTPWSWKEMLDDIWDNCLPDIAGPAPKMPYKPDGKPENYQFVGVSAWKAYNDILDRLGCAIAIDKDAKFSIVRLDGKQTGLAGQTRKLKRIYGADPVIGDRIDVAEKVQVYFYKHQERPGRERDTPRDTNWMFNDAVHTVEKKSGIPDAEKGTEIAIWDDMPAIVSQDDTVANEEKLGKRADEILKNYKALVSQEDRDKADFYHGIHDIKMGARVRGLVWRDYGDGPVTELSFSSASFPASLIVKPIDFDSRWRPMQIPNQMQLIQVWESGQPEGSYLTASGDEDFISGRVIRYKGFNEAVEALDDCWITFVDDIDGSNRTAATEAKVHAGEIFIGRLIDASIGTDSTNERPVYAVKRWGYGEKARIIRFTLTAALATTDATNASATVSEYYLGTDPGSSVTLQNIEVSGSGAYLFEGDIGDMGVAINTGDEWLIIQMECP